MRLPQLLLALLLAAGCAAPERRAAQEEGQAGAIAVGQRWADAEAIAARAGYQLHAAAGLAWQPPIDGFYVSLSGDRDLIVFRNASADAVGALQLVKNASKPKSERAHHSRQSFDLPPAAASGG